jgi:hypothetical protein
MVGGKRFERLADANGDLATPEHVRRIGFVDARVETGVDLIEGELALPCGTPHEIDREVFDDPVEPGKEARRAVERRKSAINAEERFLNDFECVLFVTNEADRDGERTPPVTFHELAKRAAIASLSTQNELTITLRFSRTT